MLPFTMPVAAGTPILVAVSGGADSVALWDLLAAGGAVPVVWHLDHGLRPESAVDAAWVAQRARRLGHEAIVEHADIAALATGMGCGIEEAGRTHRYARLAEVARSRGIGTVATAHHADDRAESILMHLLRGAGPGGWQGIAAERPLEPGIRLVRPLLALHRRDLRGWLRERGEPWREDASNRDQRFTRNRIRAMLAEWEAVAPGFADALLAVADRQADGHRRLTAEADACLQAASVGDGLRVAPLQSARREVRMAALAVHLMVLGVAADRGRLHRLADLVAGAPGRRLQLGAITWLRRADRVVWERREPG